MNNKVVILILLAFGLTVACSHKVLYMGPMRGIQSVYSDLEAFNNAPIAWLEAIKAKSPQALCNSEMWDKSQTLEALDFDTMNREQMKTIGQDWLKKSFELRLRINDALPELESVCQARLIPFLRNLRQAEDYIGEIAYNEKDRNAFDVDFKKVKPPILDEKAYSPYQLNPKFKTEGGFKFKAGDVLATRGISFVSATIGQMTEDRTHFSHGVFVHENDKGTIQTIESYLQKGVEFYSLEDAMKNENTRIMIFRAKDQELARKASQTMGDKLRSLQKEGKGIPYDYYMNHKEHSRMTCGEVIIASYEWASNEKFLIPAFQSPIRFKNPEVLDKLNIVEKETFSPALMEIDPRFELVLDWRDYSLIRDQRQKDVTVKKILEWMEKKEYKLYETLTTMGLRVIWSTRNTPLWKIVSKPFDLDTVPKDTPRDFILAVAQMRGVGEIILKEVKKADLAFEAENGYPMTEKRLLDFLEKFREEDNEKFQSGQPTKFHQIFAPPREERPEYYRF